MAAYRWMADSRVSLVPRFPFHIHLTRYTSILTLISGTWNVTHGFFIVGYVWCSTKGEAPERGWVGPNTLAPSTKEMGPGSCRDTLDFHFADANHKKVIGLGMNLS